MQQALDDEGISFGQNDRETNVSSANTQDDDGIVYTPAVTLWAMLSQALFTDVQRSCNEWRCTTPCWGVKSREWHSLLQAVCVALETWS